MSTDNQQLASIDIVIQSDEMRDKIQSLLPPGVSLDRFTQTVISAVQNNPDVLSADRQSLYNSVQRAAADGLMPDGKEGAMVVFNKKHANGSMYKVVQWMPMVEGIIKQMGKAGIKAYAVSVYEGEEFSIWNDDAGQHVLHKPNPFGPKGTAIGVFACARFDGQTYIEALNMEDIEQIRQSSRAANGGPWAAWPGRMAQKSALHRLKKRLPILDPAIVASLRDPEEDLDVVAETTAPAEGEAQPQPVQKRRAGKVRQLMKLEPTTVAEMVTQSPALVPAAAVVVADEDEGEVF
jgi:recombination protein RecT